MHNIHNIYFQVYIPGIYTRYCTIILHNTHRRRREATSFSSSSEAGGVGWLCTRTYINIYAHLNIIIQYQVLETWNDVYTHSRHEIMSSYRAVRYLIYDIYLVRYAQSIVDRLRVDAKLLACSTYCYVLRFSRFFIWCSASKRTSTGTTYQHVSYTSKYESEELCLYNVYQVIGYGMHVHSGHNQSHNSQCSQSVCGPLPIHLSSDTAFYGSRKLRKK